MKIALAQLNYHTGNFEYNSQKIVECILKAREKEAELIVFAELALTGYPPRDFLEFDEFLTAANTHLKYIAEQCKDIHCILGAPFQNPSKKGKRLFNSAFLLGNGKILDRVDKSLLPNYDVFDEYRYFEPAQQTHCIQVNGKKIALTICEDLWNVSDSPLYVKEPMEALIQEEPELIINIAASPFSQKQQHIRQQILQQNSKKYGLPLLYVNHVGAQTELIFDGGSLALNAQGDEIDGMAFFKEELCLYECAGKTLTKTDKRLVDNAKERIEMVHDALVLGIKDYFKKQGFTKAILGSSGGIDSAVVQVLASSALGSENVTAVLMPSRYSSDHSVRDAQLLSENLGNPHHIIPIEDPFQAFNNLLAPFFKDAPIDVTEENVQARSRAIILMALSNKFGSILLNTSNKSENAVGYGTLYGDMAGGLSVIGDLFKTHVYEIAHFINRHTEVIPMNIITKEPSAELRPNQKDSDSLPDYAILDAILFQYIENRKGPESLIKMGFDETLVRRIIRLVNLNEYKRHQTPPILRISGKAFGMGRRMPIVAKYLQ